MPASSGMTFNVRVDDAAVVAGLRSQRREIRQDVKRLSLTAANETVLPTARSLAAPSRLRRSIIAKSTTNGARLSTSARGMDRRVIGLLNFGGTVTTLIRPKDAKALYLGGGIFRASVAGPRHYRPKRFLERSVEANLTRFCSKMEHDLAKVMQSRLAYGRAFS